MNFNKLTQHFENKRDRSITDLFDDARSSDFSVQTDGMLFDYSKTNIDTNARTLLLELAKTANLTAKRDAMFSGATLNETENRAVLHTALRNLDATPGYG